MTPDLSSDYSLCTFGILQEFICAQARQKTELLFNWVLSDSVLCVCGKCYKVDVKDINSLESFEKAL